MSLWSNLWGIVRQDKQEDCCCVSLNGRARRYLFERNPPIRRYRPIEDFGAIVVRNYDPLDVRTVIVRVNNVMPSISVHFDRKGERYLDPPRATIKDNRFRGDRCRAT